jgi:hypothetical protein
MNNDSFKSSENGKKPNNNPETSSRNPSPNNPTPNNPGSGSRNPNGKSNPQASGPRPTPTSTPSGNSGPKDARSESWNANRTEEERKEAEREAAQNKNRQSPNRGNTTFKQEDFLKYATSNKEHMIAYGILILGLFILLFFHSLLGGLIIGGVAGYYFSSEIVSYLRNCTQVGMGKDQVRFFILAALFLGFLIAAPGIFIGAVIVAIFTQVLTGPSS